MAWVHSLIIVVMGTHVVDSRAQNVVHFGVNGRVGNECAAKWHSFLA